MQRHRTLKDYVKETLLTSTLDEGLQHDILELAETWGANNGDPFEKQSLKWVWLEECLDGENRFVSSTHQQIIKRISEAVVNANIHLSTSVEAIVSQEMEKGDKKLIVKTTNGNFEFDEVVVTIPLGCLKLDTLQFHPNLPQNISQAITDASYGRLEKVFVAFAAPFWERSETDASQGGDTYPMFTHFLRPTYALEEQRSWTLEMLAVSSTALFGAHAQPLLVFHLWRAAAAHITSAIASLTPSSDEYYIVIDTLFQPFYSRLPNYKEDCPDCAPTAVLATKWQNDEPAGNGSYTNFTTHYRGGPLKGNPAIHDGIRAMRHGLPERGLWFAGEHTAPFVALGTSTGAYWSGEAVATRIMERYTLPGQLRSD
ncbi:MAG: hypothetical protein L6R36_007188 [Xanthoria steineri]|nr:MAG: hypothetical protein L6R36_007188 [Xanthoria steineri]